jgi:flagellar biosynthetic protein FlhB
MMTKREVREEQREQDGDPLIKSRIRAKQLAFARSRMMAEVPRATVVLTNPTHVAVALRYVPGETEVPKVVAKGAELLAARIREIAREHGVPIVSDPPLARSLYRTVRIGSEIPTALYRAVAEVLAIVLSRRGGASRRPSEIPS